MSGTFGSDALWVAAIRRKRSPTLAPWHAPKLLEAGRPFEPGTSAPGAMVTWIDGAGDVLSGQVWSLAPRVRGRETVWVVQAEQWATQVPVSDLTLSPDDFTQLQPAQGRLP